MYFLKKHPCLCSFLLAEAAGFFAGLFYMLFASVHAGAEEFLFYALFTGTFLLHPLVLTGINLFFTFAPSKFYKYRGTARRFEWITILLGSLYSLFLLPFMGIQFQADWPETLRNSQMHTPIWTEAYPTVFFLSLLGIAGYLLLSLLPLGKMPPLVIVLSMSAMYLGVAECLAWIVQIFRSDFLLLCLFPFNCILIAAKTVRACTLEWGRLHPPSESASRSDSAPASQQGLLGRINAWLYNARRWYIVSFLLMWPLLGLCIALLALFGQRPDAVLRAWTETSGWNLSQKVSPPNLYYDEHYLCTVAAGGHRKLVKPLRMGVRHGHIVIVNRQLCIANAFEQLLEERLPGLHRRIRHFYDTYGLPIARHIRSPYTADIVYLLMKPLEYFFLFVLYLCDTEPENRIARMYPPPGAELSSPAARPQ